jgi:hypothetical protein
MPKFFGDLLLTAGGAVSAGIWDCRVAYISGYKLGGAAWILPLNCTFRNALLFLFRASNGF